MTVSCVSLLFRKFPPVCGVGRRREENTVQLPTPPFTTGSTCSLALPFSSPHTAHTSLYDVACALTASGSETNYVAANLPQWAFDNIPFPSPYDSGVDIKHEFV